VECPKCGVQVEDFPWAEPWARVTTALSNTVAKLARELSWQGTARQYGLNWKSVATIVRRAVDYGLRHRTRPPVHVIGIDDVSRTQSAAQNQALPSTDAALTVKHPDSFTQVGSRLLFSRRYIQQRAASETR
jgi:hypothetical protein